MSELMKLVPDSAPFNDEQRAWLNGFLAGWVGMQGGDLGAGMANGTALLDAPAEAVEEEEEDFDWHDPGVPMDDRLEATKDKPLKRKLMAAMAQLDCGACGYICQTYSEAIASGEESDLTLCSPGGKETSKMVKKLLKESGGAEEAGGGAAAAAPAETGWSRKNPFPAKLVRGFNLNGEGSAKYTTHVEIDLEGSGLEYVVGDSLGVYPTNCDDLVADVAGAVGLNGEVTPALKSEKDLADVSEELLEVLEKSTKDLGEKIKIKGWLSDDSKLEGMDVLDVLRSVPKAEPSGEDFLDSLSPLKPRLYSISSSPKAHPGQVHLTVGRVSWAAGERTRKGVASTMLADRVDEGAEVKVFVHKSHGFTVPSDPSAPMIMCGPGTGIAPFRAFLEERDATKAPGDNWLFFGDQKGDTDYLYRDQINDWVEAGVLNRVSTAFSRDQEKKVYVQHRMLEEAEELWAWLDRGGYFFVCGDAKRMAADVDKALHEVIAGAGGKGADGAKKFIEEMKSDGRYSRDVY